MATSRRQLIATAAAIPAALTVTAVPAPAAADPCPALWAECLRLEAAYVVATDVYADAWTALEQRGFSEIGPRIHGGRNGMSSDAPVDVWCYDEQQIRARFSTWLQLTVGRRWEVELQNRIDAFREQQRAWREATEAANIPALEAAMNDAYDRWFDCERALIDTPATTPAGVAAKLRWLLRQIGHRDSCWVGKMDLNEVALRIALTDLERLA